MIDHRRASQAYLNDENPDLAVSVVDELMPAPIPDKRQAAGVAAPGFALRGDQRVSAHNEVQLLVSVVPVRSDGTARRDDCEVDEIDRGIEIGTAEHTAEEDRAHSSVFARAVDGRSFGDIREIWPAEPLIRAMHG
jgi:hypothetical protein